MSVFKLRNHFGAFATAADLPNVAGSPNVRANLAVGCLAYVIATQQLMVCTSPTPGAGSWVGIDATPALRRFVVAGQSNGNRTDLDIVNAELTGMFETSKVTQGSTGFGSPDFEWLPTSLGGPGTELQNLLTATAGWGSTLRAINWNQWEADAGPANSGEYQTRLEAFIAEMRAHTWSGLRFVIVAANPDSTKNDWAVIRAAQEAVVAADPLVTLLVLDDLTIANGLYDGLHYTLGPGLGAEIMSARVGVALEAIP